MQGDKNIIKFDGDHNSSRPQFYYDSVSIFFYNVLHPPRPPSAYPNKVEKCYDLGDLKGSASRNEVISAAFHYLSTIFLFRKYRPIFTFCTSMISKWSIDFFSLSF